MSPSRLTPRAAAFLIAAALALAVANSVFQVPIQVSDSLDAIVVARQAPSASSLFMNATGWSGTTLRPLRYMQARALVTLADAIGVSYNAVFRGTHAGLVVALLLVFVWTARVEHWTDVAAIGFALTVFVGLHTFGGMTREAFPVNHFAEIALCTLVVFGIAQRAPRWYGEALALALLTLCLLLIESGVLVWVVIVTCAVLRMPGVRPRTAASATLILLLYAGARYQLGIVAPGIGGHGSGYGGVFYSANELRDRFGAHPVPFMTYNIVSGGLSVLLSEPRYGVYQLLSARIAGKISPVVFINMTSSLLVTAALGWYTWGLARRNWRQWTAYDRTVVAAIVVLGTSSVLCAAYIKDEILSVAGAFYAMAAFVVARAIIERAWTSGRMATIAVATIFFAVSSPLWSFRAVGAHFDLRRAAFSTRNDWSGVLSPDKREDWPADPRQRAIMERLKEEALRRTVASPSFLPRWGDKYWIE